jgi:hypothetical protein
MKPLPLGGGIGFTVQATHGYTTNLYYTMERASSSSGTGRTLRSVRITMFTLEEATECHYVDRLFYIGTDIAV